MLFGTCALLASWLMSSTIMALSLYKNRSGITKTAVSEKGLKKLIADEIKKQLPDADKLFSHFNIFITICIFLFTAMFMLILKFIR